MMKLLCILLSSLLLYQAFALRRHCGTWLTPAGIWNILWFLLIFIPLIAAPKVPANPLAILYILITATVFSLPVLQTRWADVWSVARFDTIELYQTKGLRLAFLAASIGAVASAAINLSVQGVTLDRLSTDFLTVTNELIVDRYTDSTVYSVFAQVSNVLTYCAAGLGGLVFLGARNAVTRLLILAVTMASPLAQMSIAGAKGAIFLAIAIFYGAFLAGRKRLGGTEILNRRNFFGLLIAIMTLVPFITLSFMARGLYGPMTSADLAAGLYRNFISYSSAHIYAFSDWFTWYIGQESALTYTREGVAGGFNTFYSVFKALGSTKVVPPGFYDEYYQYSWYLQTNIYTVFRGLISDFTIVGSLLFMYVAGFLFNTLFLALVRSQRPSWSIALYMLFCGLAYTSFIISIFVWNSMYPVVVIIAVVLNFNHGWAASERGRRGNMRTTGGLASISRPPSTL